MMERIIILISLSFFLLAILFTMFGDKGLLRAIADKVLELEKYLPHTDKTLSSQGEPASVEIAEELVTSIAKYKDAKHCLIKLTGDYKNLNDDWFEFRSVNGKHQIVINHLKTNKPWSKVENLRDIPQTPIQYFRGIPQEMCVADIGELYQCAFEKTGPQAGLDYCTGKDFEMPTALSGTNFKINREISPRYIYKSKTGKPCVVPIYVDTLIDGPLSIPCNKPKQKDGWSILDDDCLEKMQENLAIDFC